eukprot:TRINITY_DN27572_c0_g1_i1.p1 TRINITY_DN27572_c0_g1~~TRINITY_DN27572_c0_g1_i1.p1  ORF type:complete len:217 (+),score=7.18 TRINITY_DN27572_c0_g1_i1:72-722(+)
MAWWSWIALTFLRLPSNLYASKVCKSDLPGKKEDKPSQWQRFKWRMEYRLERRTWDDKKLRRQCCYDDNTCPEVKYFPRYKHTPCSAVPFKECEQWIAWDYDANGYRQCTTNKDQHPEKKGGCHKAVSNCVLSDKCLETSDDSDNHYYESVDFRDEGRYSEIPIENPCCDMTKYSDTRTATSNTSPPSIPEPFKFACSPKDVNGIIYQHGYNMTRF